MTQSYLKQFPDENGFFGKFGGSFVPEPIAKAMEEINQAYNLIAQNSDFIAELRKIRKHFQGRPTPIYFAHNLTKEYGGAGICTARRGTKRWG